MLSLTVALSLMPAMDITASAAKPELIITVGKDIETGLDYLYDNTNTKTLTQNDYLVSGLNQGDEVQNVTITTNRSNAGTYDMDMYTLSYDIVNTTTGQSVKSDYEITENKNDVNITKRTITVDLDSATKVYDGTPLTCTIGTARDGGTDDTRILAGETITFIDTTPDSTITHVGSTANKIDGSFPETIVTKADGSDSSMNYNCLAGNDGELTVIKRGVALFSSSAEKDYDGTPLQYSQVYSKGFHYGPVGEVVIDEDGGFLDGDGCTYDFVSDNCVIDKGGNVVAWTVSEQCDTAYGIIDFDTSLNEKGVCDNEFNYNNFTSIKFGSYESDYDIIYGGNQEGKGLDKSTLDLYGKLTVNPAELEEPEEEKESQEEEEDLSVNSVQIKMNDYSWTYDYQAKTNGYFDDGYTVTVIVNGQKTEKEFKHSSEGEAVALTGNDTIVVTVEGENGPGTCVHHVGYDKQNKATFTIYRDGVDVTEELKGYYNVTTTGGKLQIVPRPVTIATESATKIYDGEELTARSVYENGFIYGEGAAYEVTGSQTEVGYSENTFAITKLLTDTKAADYDFNCQPGTLFVVQDDDVKQAIADINTRIDINEGFNGNGFDSADSKTVKSVLGNTGFVKTKLVGVEVDESEGYSKVIKYIFDVTPYTAISKKAATPLSKNITFRLPLNNPDNFAYADIYHEDEFIKQVSALNVATYIEVSADEYSNYSYELTNVRRKKGGSGISRSSSASTVSSSSSSTNTSTSADSEKQVQNGKKVSSFEKPTQEKKIFKGWYSDEALTKPVSDDDTVDEKATLYPSFDWDPKYTLNMFIGKKDASAFGENVTNDVAPLIRSDRTMLPARFVAENLGAKVEWDADTETVTITSADDETVIKLVIGSNKALVNDKEVTIDSEAFIENDRTYTPVRFVAETLGAEVEWVEDNQEVIIIK